MKKHIILASASPRRHALLAQLGLTFDVSVSDVDETAHGTAFEQVGELALRKALAVRDSIQKQSDAIIIAADTLVAVDGRVLAKPADAADAFDMLKTLSGRGHTVYTGVALIKIDTSDEIITFTESADVHFRTLIDAEIRGYIATGEPFDKAGAYGVQDIGGCLVERVEGDYYTVVGLPLARLVVALAKFGVNVLQAKI